MKINKHFLITAMLSCLCFTLMAQTKQTKNLNIDPRKGLLLDGTWNVHIAAFDGNGGEKMSLPSAKGKVDESFLDRLKVPGDWNSQQEKLYYYESTIFYKRTFEQNKKQNKRYFIHFGAVNYEATVYLNGKKVGKHIGGFTPFDFEVTNTLNEKENTLVVKVNATRHKNAIPTIRYDWWNYGGITRSVKLIEVADTYIHDYNIQLNQNKPKEIVGWVQMKGDFKNEKVSIEIPELKLRKKISIDENGKGEFLFKSKKIIYWNPTNPKQYNVLIRSKQDKVAEKIGFRTIIAKEGEILLNGERVFLRGINIHEEAPMGAGRVTTVDECLSLLRWAKELGCNFIRLAHYPHNAEMIKEAEKLGIMVWEEIPVYWNIDFESTEAYQNAEFMLEEMIERDKNRASVILWSVANETRESDARQDFLVKLLKKVKKIDKTRLTTAAIEAYKVENNVRIINDVIIPHLDVIGINCYCGWYFEKPENCKNMGWDVQFKKPVIFSEFGAGALQGHFGEKNEKWTENYQDEVFKGNIEMIKEQMPFLDGMTPWLLMDFRSPIRPNRKIQNDYNRKGVISENGIKKKAFFTLQKFYKEVLENDNQVKRK